MPNVNEKSNRDQMLITVQKQCARDLMSAISKLPWTKDAVVVGGAPRDWFMDKPATDIDIFLIDTTIGEDQLLHHMEQAGFGGIKRAPRKHSADRDPNGEVTYYTNPKIKAVYDGCTSFRPSIDHGSYVVKFQIIVTFCKSVAELLETFPVEISKFTWNHLTGRITGEPGALADVQNKTLTQTTRDVTQGRYVRKIAAKFPDHLCLDKTNTSILVQKVLPPSPAEDQVKEVLKRLPIELTAEQVSVMINSGVEPVKPSKQPLDPTAFAYWLQGFFEMTNATSVDERQTQFIKDHLALVFNKVTPDRAHVRVVPPTAILPAKTLVSC